MEGRIFCKETLYVYCLGAWNCNAVSDVASWKGDSQSHQHNYWIWVCGLKFKTNKCLFCKGYLPNILDSDTLITLKGDPLTPLRRATPILTSLRASSKFLLVVSMIFSSEAAAWTMMHLWGGWLECTLLLNAWRNKETGQRIVSCAATFRKNKPLQQRLETLCIVMQMRLINTFRWILIVHRSKAWEAHACQISINWGLCMSKASYQWWS